MTMYKPSDFNSIMVQLKLTNEEGGIKTVQYFNSIMVQLKHVDVIVDGHFTIFQFHNGTIKTHQHL